MLIMGLFVAGDAGIRLPSRRVTAVLSKSIRQWGPRRHQGTFRYGDNVHPEGVGGKREAQRIIDGNDNRVCVLYACVLVR